MSVYCSSLAWRHGPADRNDLLVLLAIADFADDDGYCWPSIKSLAQKARMTERGVQKIVRRLEVLGLVSIQTGAGRRGCNEYTLNLGVLQKGERETLNRVHPEQSSPRTREHKPRTDEHEGVNGGSPEPSGTINNHQDDDDGVCEADDFRGKILEACGLSEEAGAALVSPANMAEARRWLELPHVTEDRACEQIRVVMARKGDGPPHSLAYFTPEMQRMSADMEASKAPLAPQRRRQPSRGEAVPMSPSSGKADLDKLAEFWALKLAGGGYVAPSAITPALGRRMLDRGLVTPADLCRVGVKA